MERVRNDLEIREFYGEEIRKFKQLCSVLLFFPMTDKAIDEAIEKDKAMTPQERGFIRIGAFEDDVMAAMEIHKYEVLFNGMPIKMAGIGNVVSSIEARGKGAIKRIYKKAFEMMRNEGQIVSHLYPFRGDYYRKYGYEVTAEITKWKIPTEMIHAKADGEIRHFDGSDKMKEDIKNVYNNFIKNKNLSIVNKKWDSFFEQIEPYSKSVFPYIHYSNGRPDGYLSYGIKTYDDKIQDIEVKDFWYSDISGISGMLNYFSTLKDYSDRVVIPCNDDLSAFCEFNGGWGKRNTDREIEYMGSTRVVDVYEILKLRADKVDLTIETEDEYCPWNNDIFTVKDGKVTRGGECVDAKMSIRTFSALIMGRYEKYELVPELEIYNKNCDLSKLFPKREIFIDEHF